MAVTENLPRQKAISKYNERLSKAIQYYEMINKF